MAKKESYTSASVKVPAKVLRDLNVVRDAVECGIVPPSHVQLCPTNRCNLNCTFCSCGEREKGLELTFEEIKDIFLKLYTLGTKAVTITGGGEPCMHKDINKIVAFVVDRDIQVGLVSNGLMLDKLDGTTIDSLTWCRISFDDSRDFEQLRPVLDRAIERGQTDWAFSYVLNDNFSKDTLKVVVEYANKNYFTHVRIVDNIFKPDEEHMNEARKTLIGIDSRVIYQPRDVYTKGAKECYVSLLKPTIGADGNFYPCCGVQYAFDDKTKNFDERASMGKIDAYRCHVKDGAPFDGSACIKCYYDNYNLILSAMVKELEHERFL